VGEKATWRAAFITVRRAICERFPAGRERRAWLRWLDRKTPPHRQAALSYPI